MTKKFDTTFLPEVGEGGSQQAMVPVLGSGLVIK